MVIPNDTRGGMYKDRDVENLWHAPSYSPGSSFGRIVSNNLNPNDISVLIFLFVLMFILTRAVSRVRYWV